MDDARCPECGDVGAYCECPPRQGWDLVTSRPLTPEESAAADELARIEAGKPKGRESGKRKPKGGAKPDGRDRDHH